MVKKYIVVSNIEEVFDGKVYKRVIGDAETLKGAWGIQVRAIGSDTTEIYKLIEDVEIKEA